MSTAAKNPYEGSEDEAVHFSTREATELCERALSFVAKTEKMNEAILIDHGFDPATFEKVKAEAAEQMPPIYEDVVAAVVQRNYEEAMGVSADEAEEATEELAKPTVAQDFAQQVIFTA
jgi:hypothetical protein